MSRTSDDEGFLTRWTRLKREAKRPPEPEPPATPMALPATPEPARGAVPDAGPDGQTDAFDPATLPSIDAIDATTDIRAFLSRGVPTSLTTAALRRAWAADPAIRDFVGLSENAWDFNAPNTIPGFGGTLAPHEVRDLVARIAGQSGETPEAVPAAGGDSIREASAGGQAPGIGESPADGREHEVVKSVAEPQPPSSGAPDKQIEAIADKNIDVASRD